MVDKLLVNNLDKLIKCNSEEAKVFATELGISIKNLLTNPIEYLSQIEKFLQKFELSLPSIMTSEFQPIELVKFKKANSESVSNELIENLKTIAILYREKKALENKKLDIFPNDYNNLDDIDLIDKIHKDLDFNNFLIKFSKSDGKQRNFLLKELIKDMENLYGLKTFFINEEKSPFNFDGVYFNKPIATIYINAHYSYYTKAIFTLLHEIYHFFKDDGKTFTFDLFDNSEVNQYNKAEDIRANRFAIDFLLYKADEELNKLRTNPTQNLLKETMKRYCVSREALAIKLDMKKLNSIKVGRTTKTFFPFASTEINDLLTWHCDEASISYSRKIELEGAIKE